MSEVKLLGCPFCGGQPVIKSHRWAGNNEVKAHYVHCQKCNANSHGRNTVEKTVAFWNTRAPAVPEGWQLVPVVPTQEMMKAADDALMFTYRASDWDEAKDVIEGISLKEIYDKFIAAAPKVTP